MEPSNIRRVIGLDAHPTLFSAVALEGADPLSAREVWNVDRCDLTQLEAILRKRAVPGDVIVLEASGNSFTVAERLNNMGLCALVLDSKSVSQIGSSFRITDKIDARKLARVYLAGLANIVWRPSEKAREQRELFFAYRSAVKDTTREKNRLWAFLNQYCVTKGKIRLTQPDTLSRLLALRAWTPVQQVLLRERVETLQAAMERRAHLNQWITREVLANPDILRLTRLLGIRAHVAFALAAFIGDIHRFATPKKLVAFFGLNPRVIQSGQNGGTGPLSKEGRSDVRALLIQAAQSIMKYGQGSVHRWGLYLKIRKGHNIAVAALARKLVVSVWYLMQGHMVPMEEATAHIVTKLRKFATQLGAQQRRELGYENVDAFINDKLGIIMGTS